MYCEVSNGVRIEVEPTYVSEESQPSRSYYVFAYRVVITNENPEKVQLLNRHWIITDGKGVVHEVKGPGVIGFQPVLAQGESFEYSSFCPLSTPTGNMRGSYEMADSHQKLFQVTIPLFFLRDMRHLH